MNVFTLMIKNMLTSKITRIVIKKGWKQRASKTKKVRYLLNQAKQTRNTLSDLQRTYYTFEKYLYGENKKKLCRTRGNRTFLKIKKTCTLGDSGFF